MFKNNNKTAKAVSFHERIENSKKRKALLNLWVARQEINNRFELKKLYSEVARIKKKLNSRRGTNDPVS